jgi:NAD(P)-dependent dehydrogenase (short-subunit alcohol dehydrogenase family)
MSSESLRGKWALILGASSGFGEATALAMADAGMNIFGVHLDLKATMPHVKEIISKIEAKGSKAVYFNTNAADPRKRQRVLDKIEKVLADDPEDSIHVFMHSLAFGTLLPFIADDPEQAVSQAQMDMTLNVMAHSLVYWVQDIVRRGLFTRGSRIFAMTSEGSHRVVPGYGAVSAAKAALESHVRQLAMELAPMGVLSNCIQAGVTVTPALLKIPGHEKLVEGARARHPDGRLTTTKDVADTIVALSDPKLVWISGTVIRVDGGEDVIG